MANHNMIKRVKWNMEKKIKEMYSSYMNNLVFPSLFIYDWVWTYSSKKVDSRKP